MKKIIFCCFFLLNFAIWGQNPGYLGKKNVIDVFVSAQTPLFSNTVNFNNNSTSYVKKGNKLEPKRDNFDVGYHINISRAFSRRFGMGVEFGNDYYSILLSQPTKLVAGDYNTISYTGEQENMSVRSQIIMPKLEFSSKGGLLPIGITHQIGFGFRTMHLIQKQYLFNFEFYDSDFGTTQPLSTTDVAEYRENLVDYTKVYIGKTFMYCLNLRTPISKSLILNYGVRYTLNTMKISNEYLADQPSINWYNEHEIQTLLVRKTSLSLIYLNFGLSYAF